MPGSNLADQRVVELEYLNRALSLRSSQKGRMVAEFEEAFARRVGAKHAISHCNGTSTMHSALVALGVKPGDRVSVPPLTYASTTLAVLHAGAIPEYHDVDEHTWLAPCLGINVSLYGLDFLGGYVSIRDAAETLNPHQLADFTSYSFEASKVLPIGEGGMLVTNDDDLAWKARQFRCVGYHRGGPEDESVFAPSRRPDAIRHDVIGWNYLMSDLQAAVGLARLLIADEYFAARAYSAACYAQVVSDYPQFTPQSLPEGWPMTWWVFGLALKTPQQWEPLANAIQQLGGEIPRGAFRLTYQEPAFRHLAPDGTCPVAEDLQPRLIQLATNHTKDEAERAAEILHRALAMCD